MKGVGETCATLFLCYKDLQSGWKNEACVLVSSPFSLGLEKGLQRKCICVFVCVLSPEYCQKFEIRSNWGKSKIKEHFGMEEQEILPYSIRIAGPERMEENVKETA